MLSRRSFLRGLAALGRPAAGPLRAAHEVFDVAAENAATPACTGGCAALALLPAATMLALVSRLAVDVPIC